MAILTTRYERKNMSEKQKKFEKKHVLYLVIAGLLIIIIILSFYIHALRNRSTTTIVTAPTKVKSSGASSSTSKYVEGKDYTVKYSNDGIVAKSSIDEALSYGGLNNIDNDMDKDSGNYAKFEFYFNKSKNVIVEKLYDNGYQNNQPTMIVAYDLSKKKMIDGYIGRLYYDNQPLVYTWTNNTVE